MTISISGMSYLAVRVLLPLVLDGVVALHGRALLLAHAVVVKVAAGKAVGLLGAGAPACAEQVAALAGLGAETPALVTLGAAKEIKLCCLFTRKKYLPK